MENPAPIRTAIDSGRTGDKVDYPDPAAAPLGTDEEAAGTRLSPDAVQQALNKELEIGALVRRDHHPRGTAALAIALLLLSALTAVLITVSQLLQS